MKIVDSIYCNSYISRLFQFKLTAMCTQSVWLFRAEHFHATSLGRCCTWAPVQNRIRHRVWATAALLMFMTFTVQHDVYLAPEGRFLLHLLKREHFCARPKCEQRRHSLTVKTTQPFSAYCYVQFILTTSCLPFDPHQVVARALFKQPLFLSVSLQP